MDFIEENVIYILIAIIVAVVFVLIIPTPDKHVNNSFITKKREKDNTHLNFYKNQCNILEKENKELKDKISKLTSENAELKKTAKEPPIISSIVKKELPRKKKTEDIIRYASFPRSAGDSSYFSDLTENQVEDSYFEFKIVETTGKATFKPLDFMKIRSYDPAAPAMLTEGVKPSNASTVLKIEPGTAYMEGKDWIIETPAKIKLA